MHIQLTKFLFFCLFIFIFGCTGTKPMTVAERIDPKARDRPEPSHITGNSIASSIGPYEASAYIQSFELLDTMRASLFTRIAVDHKNKTVDYYHTSFNGSDHLCQVSDGILLWIIGYTANEERLIRVGSSKYYEYLNQIGDTTYHLIAANLRCIPYDKHCSGFYLSKSL
jgi:hypothetical protein